MGHAVPKIEPLTEDQKSKAIENIGLAYFAVNKIRAKHPRIPPNHALSIAFMALIRSVQTYRPEVETRLSTWFGWQVRAEISVYYREIRPAGYKRNGGPPTPKTIRVRPDVLARVVNNRYRWSI
jgi:DNA-directed RNA polymerase specialized sigma subunit